MDIYIHTAKGNQKSPSHSTIIQFVSNLLQKIQSEMIVKSFLVCGISALGPIPISTHSERLKSVHLDSDRIVNFPYDSGTEVDENDHY